MPIYQKGQTMKISNLVSLTIGTVLILNTPAAHASQANGTYSVDAGAYVLLWDLSESYDTDVGIGGFNITIAQEPNGTLSGSGDLYVNDLGISLDMPADVSGKVSGSSTAPKVTLDGVATFSGDYGDAYFNYLDVALKLSMEISAANGDIAGTGSGTVKYSAENLSTGKTAKGSKSASTGAVDFTLPGDVNGDWGLTLTLTPDGTKYTGTAEVETSVGDTVDFTVTGTYSASKDTSTLALKGTGWGTGTSLNLVISTSGSNINILSCKGKLFGQTLNFKAP